MGFSSERLASKYCDGDGGWWIHPSTNLTWSNYTECVDFQKLYFHRALNFVHLIALIISVFSLSCSLFIFFFFDYLDCDRILIHKNLLATLWLSSTSWICWIYFVLYDTEVWLSNITLCRMIHIITTYFTLTTYTWMLCEGILLKLLLTVLNLNERDIMCLCFVGWIIPIFIMIPYVLHRVVHEDENCWMDSGQSNWIIGVPVLLVILINIIILIYVIRILRSKLKDTQNPPQTERAMENTVKQAKAILLLAPILGLSFLPFPIRPAEGSQLELVYDVLMAVFCGFQGTLVSFLVCFSNSEVHAVVKRRWNQYVLKD